MVQVNRALRLACRFSTTCSIRWPATRLIDLQIQGQRRSAHRCPPHSGGYRHHPRLRRWLRAVGDKAGASVAMGTPMCRSTRRSPASSSTSPGRPGLEYQVDFTRARIGEFDVDLFLEFFPGVGQPMPASPCISTTCAASMPIIRRRRCSRPWAGRCAMALEPDPRMAEAIPSTKGSL